MGLPSKLKQMNFFEDGTSWAGEIAELTLPKLEREMEGWRGGGMIGEVMWDKGQKAIELEFKAGGWMRSIAQKWGAAQIDAVGVRFVGAYEDIGTGALQAVTIIARGRYTERDPGKAKSGNDTEQSYKLACVYYREEVNGVVDVEIDFLNGTLISGGIDRTAELRALLDLT